ncbi:hypothetical protein IJZ97_05500, partial [bacterium]|nr:hypothetical protein [bacterium]
SVRPYDQGYGASVALPRSYEERDEILAQLEEQKNQWDNILEDNSLPKPVRIIGKAFRVGLAAAAGFVSMQIGTKGVVKLLHKGAELASNFVKKPIMQKVVGAFSNLELGTKNVFKKLGSDIKNLPLVKKAGEAFADLNKNFKNTDFADKVSKFTKNITESDSMKAVAKRVDGVKASVKGVTPEKIEKGAIDLFAVSGGVTGAISALQEGSEG